MSQHDETRVPTTCPNCGGELLGNYCHNCGQKRIEPGERTLKHFLYQFFGAAFFLENNFLRSLWLLLSRPGFLATEYRIGRRKRYMAPISLFLLINLGYFFWVTLSDLNLTLYEQITYQLHSGVAKAMVEKRLASRDLSMKDYEQAYNEQSTSLSKTLIILHAPTLALLLMPLYRKHKYYFTDHMVFAVYLMAFVMLFSLILFSILTWLVKLTWMSPSLLFPVSGYVIIIAFPLYFGLAIRKFYQLRWLPTLFGTVVVFFCFIVAHVIFRAELFLVVFLTT